MTPLRDDPIDLRLALETFMRATESWVDLASIHEPHYQGVFVATHHVAKLKRARELALAIPGWRSPGVDS